MEGLIVWIVMIIIGSFVSKNVKRASQNRPGRGAVQPPLKGGPEPESIRPRKQSGWPNLPGNFPGGVTLDGLLDAMVPSESKKAEPKQTAPEDSTASGEGDRTSSDMPFEPLVARQPIALSPVHASVSHAHSGAAKGAAGRTAAKLQNLEAFGEKPVKRTPVGSERATLSAPEMRRAVIMAEIIAPPRSRRTISRRIS